MCVYVYALKGPEESRSTTLRSRGASPFDTFPVDFEAHVMGELLVLSHHRPLDGRTCHAIPENAHVREKTMAPAPLKGNVALCAANAKQTKPSN